MTWEDKHSVNCIKCGKLFDERNGYTPEDGEGTVCPDCMVNPLYERLRNHIGHKIVCVCYGIGTTDPENIAIECEDCCEVIVDADRYLEDE